MWKEAVVVQFEILSCHWTAMTEDKHRNVSPGRDSLYSLPNKAYPSLSQSSQFATFFLLVFQFFCPTLHVVFVIVFK